MVVFKTLLAGEEYHHIKMQNAIHCEIKRNALNGRRTFFGATRSSSRSVS